jgi:hypothetical protein
MRSRRDGAVFRPYRVVPSRLRASPFVSDSQVSAPRRARLTPRIPIERCSTFAQNWRLPTACRAAPNFPRAVTRRMLVRRTRSGGPCEWAA